MIHPSPQIMGILNVTPDSFYDGGCHHTLDKAVARAHQMAKEGAHIIDVGGESTRPQAAFVSLSEECDRVIPVIERLKKEIPLPISIDTRHAAVMKAALEAGADMVNDVSALASQEALAVAARYGAPVCLMHMKGTPQTMQDFPIYDNVLAEIYDFFVEAIARCERAGIARDKIWIDPGFGFGKDLSHNLTLLGNLSHFKTLGTPILVGLSRKSMFGKILNLPVEQRLHSSLAAAVLAMMQGAAMIRTHDVVATKEALEVFNAVRPYMLGR